jgi:hypothetical protein
MPLESEVRRSFYPFLVPYEVPARLTVCPERVERTECSVRHSDNEPTFGDDALNFDAGTSEVRTTNRDFWTKFDLAIFLSIPQKNAILG